MGAIKRKCDNCGKEYNADIRNLRRGWGRCCCKSCAAQLREKKKPPGVINQYAPGEFYAVTESDIWLMRYCKGRLKIRLSNAPRKNDFRNKDIFLENR